MFTVLLTLFLTFTDATKPEKQAQLDTKHIARPRCMTTGCVFSEPTTHNLNETLNKPSFHKTFSKSYHNQTQQDLQPLRPRHDTRDDLR